jgi:hypothetical protein
MNKKFLYGISVFATVAVAVGNVNVNSQNDLSEVSLANIEALAVEASSSGDFTVTIYNPNHWSCNRGGGSCCPPLSGSC